MTEYVDVEQTAQHETTDSVASQEISFQALPQALQDAVTRMQWPDLMPVQRQTLPPMLAGQDVMVQSQTGSGKTGAFLLPILHRLDAQLGAPQALVLVPTRELAVQVCREAEELTQGTGVQALPIYGGVGYKAQIDGLDQGSQLIIGTPGRILDHLLKGTLNLDRLRILIFDEADRMLSMGFYPDMKQLQRYLPRGLQAAMFSATYPGHVKRLAQQFLKDPLFVSLSQDRVHATDVLHVVYKVPAMQKSRILVKVIEQENPTSGIIFCNTKADVHFVGTVLRRFGYDVGEISADLTQTAREDVLEKLRRNKLKFLVATDVAARGIDIHELSHVFQYQPPQDHEAYVHRTGRTGRAGAAGVAISFVSGMEEIELDQIAKKFSITLEERTVPSDEELEGLISQRAVFLLEARLRDADNIRKERMRRFMRVVADLATNEDSCALLAMLIDDFYQKTFHAPLEQPAEKLVEMVRPERPAGPKIVAQDNGAGGSEGERAEKKRRKRRKKPAQDSSRTGLRNDDAQSSMEQADDAVRAEVREEFDRKPEASEHADAVIVETTPAQVGVADAAPIVSATDFDFGLESIWDQTESSESSAVAPKKRRRRRPRKSSAQKAEVRRDEAGVTAPGATSELSPVPPTAASVLPVEPVALVEPVSQREPLPVDAPPARTEETRSRPTGPARDRTRSGSRVARSETPAAPAKPKKKIFLE